MTGGDKKVLTVSESSGQRPLLTAHTGNAARSQHLILVERYRRQMSAICVV